MHLPGEEETYSVSGTVADLNMRITVNVSAIGQTAGVLNYSAAVGKDAEVSLPAARPAVLADGTILAAEFPVKVGYSKRSDSDNRNKECKRNGNRI